MENRSAFQLDFLKKAKFCKCLQRFVYIFMQMLRRIKSTEDFLWGLTQEEEREEHDWAEKAILLLY